MELPDHQNGLTAESAFFVAQQQNLPITPTNQ